MASKKIAKSKDVKTENSSHSDISDKELRRIQNELAHTKNRSILIEQDIRRLRDRLSLSMCAPSLENSPAVIHKKFLFRCGKCVGEFEHNAKIAVLDHRVVCPKCKKEHLLKLEPQQGRYKLKVPKSIKLVK